MPQLPENAKPTKNVLILDELNYDLEEMQATHDRNLPKMTDEQRKIYDEIIGAVVQERGGMYFVNGFGGTEKNFLWQLLSAAVRCREDIVLNTASSGIASLLLQGGRTAHSRFSIPINPDEFATCALLHGSDKANLIKDASLIIWDEAPMMSKHSNNEALSGDFLNSIKVSGLPNYSLRLKIGCLVMLLRNSNPTEGLMNGKRLQKTQLLDHMVEARIITGEKVGKTVYIPRLLITPTDKRLPFKMRRRQLPLVVAFAIKINKSQGQSPSEMGLFLPRPVFSHGQLYVAISRVTSKKDLKVLIVDKEESRKRKL
uniref:ATP-dependent DNA helicase n=1 Tax=Brassica oleracea var. oleracea TaxID=109376 RepID=A0A0D3EAP9_BRAOL